MPQCSPAFVACTRSIAGQTTSVYATHLGNISLTWGRSTLGLYLLVDLRLAPARADDGAGHLRLCLHPYLPWKRKGSKRRRFTTPSGNHRTVELSWDLRAARFSSSRGPEPSDGFFVTVAVDGELALVAGDRKEEAYRTTSAVRPRGRRQGTDLISRRGG
ncbi:hypothetical protein HPP92_021341 [Vanilla planifolia]|uniref:Uncharacterized protein n=1 Tax=Vanilla planifolia TaxID=51239 RepID=A0A835Q1I5_VANPL|nr:hypothetical protein HPP92_021636 [Vanilla planifolia]KAG0462865.1 hypothetical protein HPP92_021341 [Vanilla planifolia]